MAGYPVIGMRSSSHNLTIGLLALLFVASSEIRADEKPIEQKLSKSRTAFVYSTLGTSLIYPGYVMHANGHQELMWGATACMLGSAVLQMTSDDATSSTRYTSMALFMSGWGIYYFYPMVSIVDGYASGNTEKAQRSWLSLTSVCVGFAASYIVAGGERVSKRKEEGRIRFHPMLARDYSGLMLDMNF